jgi:hypothetical protein
MQANTLKTIAAAEHVLMLLKSMACNDLRTRVAVVVEITSPIAILAAVEFRRPAALTVA